MHASSDIMQSKNSIGRVVLWWIKRILYLQLKMFEQDMKTTIAAVGSERNSSYTKPKQTGNTWLLALAPQNPLLQLRKYYISTSNSVTQSNSAFQVFVF